MHVEQQIHHLLAGLAVQVAGRLVGQQDFGFGGEGTRHRDALLLTARQLAGIMLEPMAEADGMQDVAGAGEGVLTAGEFQRHGDVLQRRHGGDKVEILEHDAYVIAAEARQAVFVETGQIDPGGANGSAAGLFEPGDDHHHGRFPAARRADNAHCLAGFDPKIETTQDVDLTRSTCEPDLEIGEQDRGLTGDAVLHRDTFMKVSVKIVSIISALAAMVFFALGVQAAPNDEIRLLVLGDSLAAGYGLAAPQSFTVKLQEALVARGHAVRVINAGVSGDTSAGGRARLDWVLADKPQAAIVELGANDGLRGLDVAAMRGNLAAILARFEAAGIKTLLAGMKAPPNYGGKYVTDYDAAFDSLARENKDVIFYPFFLDGVAATPDLNQPDGIHPNAKGVEIVVRNILPAVEQLLARVKASQANPAKAG